MSGSVLPLSYVPSRLHAKGGVYYTEWLLVENIPPLNSHTLWCSYYHVDSDYYER